MRILIYSSSAKFVDLIEAAEHELVFPDEDAVSASDTPVFAREAAEIAESSHCELVAFLPKGVSKRGFKHMLEVLPDSDRPTAVVIGERNGLNVGNERTVFLSQLLTGERIVDIASPVAVYPTRLLLAASKSIHESPYRNLELILFASSSGYALRRVKIDGAHPIVEGAKEPSGLSFFAPKLLSMLSPLPRKRLCERNFQREAFREFLLHPLKFISFLLRENASPAGLAAAAAAGMFLGTLPLPGLHTAAIIYVSVKLRLNKVMSVNISHLCMPPFVPIACLELGHFALNGKWLVFGSMKTVVGELRLRLIEWLLGAAILAPINAAVFWCLTYVIARAIASRGKRIG